MTVTKFQTAQQFILGADLPPSGTTTSTLLSDTLANQQLQTSTTLTNGTATGQIDTIICQVRLLAASTSETLNFFDGSVVDIYNAGTPLQSIRYLGIYQTVNADASTSATSITIGNAASAALVLNLAGTTPTFTITPNGMPFLAGRNAGYTVDNTNKNIKILNNDGANKATYILVVGGVKV